MIACVYMCTCVFARIKEILMQLKTEKEKYETFFFTYQKEKKTERAHFIKYRKELTQ